MILHDYHFGNTWSESLAKMIRDSNGNNTTFSFFGQNSQSLSEKFEWYRLKNFSKNNVNFTLNQIDSFDDPQLGAVLKNTAIILPNKVYKDTNGNSVAPIEIVRHQSPDGTFGQSVWISKTKEEEGCKERSVFMTDRFGLEFHCACDGGVLTANAC
jgi:hypothetical protein